MSTTAEPKTTEVSLQRFKEWKPGVNYPPCVEVVEPDSMQLRFLMQSYFVGMYCAIHMPGMSIPHQTGDQNNLTFCRKLKRELKKAMERGAVVTIDELRPIHTEP